MYVYIDIWSPIYVYIYSVCSVDCSCTIKHSLQGRHRSVGAQILIGHALENYEVAFLFVRRKFRSRR